MNKKLEWLRNEGIVFTGMWEPSYFMKMALSGGPEDIVWQYMHSPAHVRELHAKGINQIWTHWWKGFGLQFEAAEQELNRPLIQAAHLYGMRVIAYCTFGSYVPETLEHEVPDCMTWAQVGEHGQPATCQTTFQCFRIRPCYNSQAWLDYMKTVTRKALEMGADGIHFDNIGYNAEPDSCTCPTCTKLFRLYLDKRFGAHSPETKALGQRLFGFNDFSRVRPPWFNRWNQAVMQRQLKVSVQKAWMQFKVESIRQALQQMVDHIKSIKPDALVEANAGKGFGGNTEYYNGLCEDVHYPMLDLITNESGALGIGPHGQIVTRMRECKMGRNGGVPVMLFTKTRLDVAELFAFNSGSIGNGCDEATNAWYHAHKRYQLDAETLAEVAVLRHRETLSFNMLDPYLSVITAEQTLIEHCIPFDIIWKGNLSDLSKYRLLILPGVECLSEKEAADILRYVEGGGAVLAVGKVGVYDEWRVEYHQRGTTRVTNEAEAREAMKPQGALYNLFGDSPSSEIRTVYGKGRAGYLPNFNYKVLPKGGPEFWAIFPEHYAVPNNAAQVLELADWCLGQRQILRVQSPGRLMVELTRVGSETILHLINVEGENKPTRALVTMELPLEPKEVMAMEVGGELVPVGAEIRGRFVQLEVSDIGIYKMLVLG